VAWAEATLAIIGAALVVSWLGVLFWLAWSYHAERRRMRALRKPPPGVVVLERHGDGWRRV